MLREDDSGRIFNDFGEQIFPSCESKGKEGKEIALFILKELKEHPEERCINGGFKHRMIQTINYNKFDIGTNESESYNERVCFDCGKKANIGIKSRRVIVNRKSRQG